MDDEWEMKRSEMIGESLKIRWSYSGKGTQYEQKFGMTETITAYYPKNRASRKTKIATVFAQEIYAACPLFPNCTIHTCFGEVRLLEEPHQAC